MEKTKFRGKNIEEAVLQACEELGITKDSLEYNVISSGGEGFFGFIGKKEAVISVSKKKEQIMAKSLVEETFQDFETKPNLKPIKNNIDQKKGKKPSSSFKKNNNKKEYDTKIEISEVAIKQGKEILLRIIKFILEDSVDTKVETKIKGSLLLYKVSGTSKTGVLIGKRGETLKAIQHIVSKIINKECEKKIKMQIDVENYLKDKKQKLETLALKLAEKVQKTGRSEQMGKMSSSNRKIIHIALKNITGIKTHSTGFGFYKKLVILPEKSI